MKLLPSRSPTSAWRRRLVLLAAVLGPGLLAGLSDDDPAGITTYSILGAHYGYSLLWVLVVSTLALVLFQNLGARMGIVTGQGLAGLVRQRYGVRRASIAIVALVAANLGTTCAEFAGVAAGMELFGVSKYLSVPVAAVLVSVLVLGAGHHSVERVLMVVSAVFFAYVIAGVLAHPDWLAAARGAVEPRLPLNRDALLITTATIGTTLAPWGLSFLQSYVIDKRLTPEDLPYTRIDSVTGATLTGVIGVFIVVACAATLYPAGIHISGAADAAKALEPLAGSFASSMLGIGLVGAAMLAASILPLSTAYSVSEFMGTESALDDSFSEAPLFYGTFGFVTVVAAALVLIPGAPLVPILVLTQVLNAVLLVPLLVFMHGMARDPKVMGKWVVSRWMAAGYLVVIVLVTMSVAALFALSFL